MPVLDSDRVSPVPVRGWLMREVALAVILVGGLFLAGGFTQAATPTDRFPQKSMRVIVPYAPGGGTDFAARIIGQKMTENWGQPVIVDNRPGASATIGTDIVAKAPPDGYTFGSINAEHAIVPSIYPKIPYDPLKDFVPVTQTVTFSYVLVVHPAVPASSVKELIAAIKARGGRFNFGTAHWSGGHLAGELFKLRAGLDMTHIPYKGTGPAITDLLSGQISMMFSTAPPALPHVKSGRLRALAVTAGKRSPLLPDLPTVAEGGLAGFEATGWSGFIAPARTPAAVVEKLSQEIARVLALPDVREKLVQSGVEPVGSRPAEFGAFVARELAQWSKVIRDANLRAEQ